MSFEKKKIQKATKLIMKWGKDLHYPLNQQELEIE